MDALLFLQPCLPHLVQRDMTLLNTVLAVVLLIIALWVRPLITASLQPQAFQSGFCPTR